jgi:hypothetical protein
MKSMKVAAIAVGSVVALGAATPAFADGIAPASLNGGVNSLAADGLRSGPPLSTNALDPNNTSSLVSTVGHAANDLSAPQSKAQKSGGSLLGGLPLGK